jgi:purine catabolism regulator
VWASAAPRTGGAWTQPPRGAGGARRCQRRGRLVPGPRSLELLLSLPTPPSKHFVDRVLGPAADNDWLVESLTALLDTGCRWSEAADELGVHRHTLRYPDGPAAGADGRHPDDPEQRMELWLAVKAKAGPRCAHGRNTT